MALHGHVWDPKKDGDGLGGSSSSSTTKTSIEQMMESLDGGGGVDSAGGVAIVRPGDASKLNYLCYFSDDCVKNTTTNEKQLVLLSSYYYLSVTLMHCVNVIIHLCHYQYHHLNHHQLN